MAQKPLKETRLANEPKQAATPKPGQPPVGSASRKSSVLPSDPEVPRRGVAEILLKFVRTVDPQDFCCFAFMVAYGSPTEAARAMGIGRRTLYERIESWETRGPEYQRMLQLIPCRNTGVTPEMVPLGTTALSGEQSEWDENPETLEAMLDQIEADAERQQNYPALLRDLCRALQSMDCTNWQAIRGELIEVIDEEIPHTE